MQNAVLEFDSISFRDWLAALGIKTFVGTSGRIFPEKGIKPIQILNAIKSKILLQNVKIKNESEFIGFDENRNVKINSKGEHKTIIADYYIFALGGASWSVTGSDGKWKKYFEELKINIIPFEASNCGINISWDKHILNNHLGKPLKNISVSVDGIKLKGEAVITKYGLEGNVIYPIIPKVREKLNDSNSAEIIIDFKPENTSDELLQKINGKKIKFQNYGMALNLKREQLALIKSYSTKDEYLKPELFVEKIKNLAITVKSLRGIEEAISTIGGVDVNELNSNYSLKKYPNIFTIGEMVNWDAPTGGFLLQGAFSMGHYAAKSILK
jgi:hypothetical protein